MWYLYSKTNEELDELEIDLQREKAKRANVFDEVKKYSLYLAEDRVISLFVSPSDIRSDDTKMAAADALNEEYSNNLYNQKPKIKVIRNLRDVPKEWHTAIPWHMLEDISYITVKEFLARNKRNNG